MLEPLTETKAIVLLTDQLADAHRDLTAARLRIADLEAALEAALQMIAAGEVDEGGMSIRCPGNGRLS